MRQAAASAACWSDENGARGSPTLSTAGSSAWRWRPRRCCPSGIVVAVAILTPRKGHGRLRHHGV